MDIEVKNLISEYFSDDKTKAENFTEDLFDIIMHKLEDYASEQYAIYRSDKEENAHLKYVCEGLDNAVDVIYEMVKDESELISSNFEIEKEL